MKIDVRCVTSKYCDVKVKIDSTTVDIGLLNEEECNELASHLKDVIYDLTGEDVTEEVNNEENL